MRFDLLLAGDDNTRRSNLVRNSMENQYRECNAKGHVVAVGLFGGEASLMSRVQESS